MPFAFAVAFFAHSSVAVLSFPMVADRARVEVRNEVEARVAEVSGEREERMGACGAEARPETFYKAFH